VIFPQSASGAQGKSTPPGNWARSTWTDMLPGTCIYSPRGTVHAFKNNTDQPIRVFINIAPAGFERFFAEVAEEWAQPERDTSRMRAISKKYGIHSV